MQNIDLGTLFLMLISAGAYVAATYFMKLWVSHHALWISALIVAALLVGVVCELIVLKDEKMGQVYLVIIGLECVLVAAFAKLALNESYSGTELIGLFLIVAGVAVLQLPDTISAKQDETAARASSGSNTVLQAPQRSRKTNKLSAAL